MCDRAAAGVRHGALRDDAGGAAAGGAVGVPARRRRPAVRADIDGDVHAAADRSPRLAARDADPHRRRHGRSQAGAGRADGGDRDRGEPLDRAGAAPLSRHLRGVDHLVVDAGRAAGGAAARLWRLARGGRGARLCAVRLLRQRRAAVRCADPGLSVDPAGGGRRAGAARLAADRAAGAAHRRGDRRGRRHCGRLRRNMAAMPGPARAYHPRTRSDVVQPYPRGQAALRTWLARVVPDDRPVRDRAGRQRLCASRGARHGQGDAVGAGGDPLLVLDGAAAVADPRGTGLADDGGDRRGGAGPADDGMDPSRIDRA